MAGLLEGVEDVVEGFVDGAAGGVDADVGVLGLLVGGGDAGELGDLARPGLGVEALAVAALALLERGGDVDEEEGAAGVLDHLPHLLAGLVEGRDRAADGDPAVAGDLGGDPADPPDVGLAIGLGKGSAATQPIRRMLVSRSALEKVRPAERLRRTTSPSRLVSVRSPRSSTRSIRAWASVDLPLPERPVKKMTQALVARIRLVPLDDLSELERQLAALAQAFDRVVTGVRGDHPDTEVVVDLGITVGGQRHGHDRGIHDVRHEKRCAQQRRGREVGGAVTDQGEEDGGAELVDVAQLLVGERVGHRHERAPGVQLTDLGRGEVETPEGAELWVREHLDRPALLARDTDPGQGEALGVDQLDLTGPGGGSEDIVGESEGDRAARLR